jgi:VanZ family protein
MYSFSRARVRLWTYAPLLLWIGIIFYLSSDQGSMTSTSKLIGPVLHFLFPSAPEETIRLYHVYIRKFAHFAAYAILAFLAARAFAPNEISLIRRHWFAFSFGLILLIAVIDETGQSLNPTRSGSIYDVALDCLGALAALTLTAYRAGRRTAH